jgi:hypothetical protein
VVLKDKELFVVDSVVFDGCSQGGGEKSAAAALFVEAVAQGSKIVNCVFTKCHRAGGTTIAVGPGAGFLVEGSCFTERKEKAIHGKRVRVASCMFGANCSASFALADVGWRKSRTPTYTPAYPETDDVQDVKIPDSIARLLARPRKPSASTKCIVVIAGFVLTFAVDAVVGRVVHCLKKARLSEGDRTVDMNKP